MPMTSSADDEQNDDDRRQIDTGAGAVPTSDARDIVTPRSRVRLTK